MDLQIRMLALATLLVAAVALSDCSTSLADIPIADKTARAPIPPSGYLPVNDLPPAREDATMDPAQRAKVQAELIAVRDHQAH